MMISKTKAKRQTDGQIVNVKSLSRLKNIFSPVSTEPVTIKLMFVVEIQTTKILGQTQTTMVMVDNKEDKVRVNKEVKVRFI